MNSIRTGVAFILLAAGPLTGAASACSLPVLPYKTLPVPAPGTSQADAQALAQTWNSLQQSQRTVSARDAEIARQAAMFDAADSVLLARVDKTGRSSGAPPEFSHMNGLTFVTMKPLRWIKGHGDNVEFQLGWNGMTSCGPTPEFDAIRGEAGDVFLVYIRGSQLRQQDVIGTLAIGRVTEARTLAAADAALTEDRQ